MAESENTNGEIPSPRSRRKKNSPAGWFPRARTESYLERKIRLLQEAQGMKASLDETLGASNRHLSRIERDKRSAVTAAQEATETRKAALIEASWCRILKAARIPYMAAALELQKAEKKAAEAFNKAAALGVALKTNNRNHRASEAEIKLSTPSSKYRITASLDAAFEVDEEVAAALKSALQHVENVSAPAGEMEVAEKGESVTVDSCEVQVIECESTKDANLVCSSPQKKSHLIGLMIERVKSLQPEQRASLASIVATRGLNALLREENYEQELNAKNGKGGLGDVLVKHVSRLEADKAASKQAAQRGVSKEMKKKPGVQTDVPDLGSMLVKHVPRIEREKRLAKTAAQQLLTESASENSNGCCNNMTSVQPITREPLVEMQEPQVLSSSTDLKNEACEDPHNDDREEIITASKPNSNSSADGCWPSLDQLQPMKKMSKLEVEKQAFLRQDSNSQRRKLARDQEAKDVWGGLDLGSSLKRHVSKLEAEQAAWRRAAEEARNKSTKVCFQ